MVRVLKCMVVPLLLSHVALHSTKVDALDALDGRRGVRLRDGARPGRLNVRKKTPPKTKIAFFGPNFRVSAAAQRRRGAG